MRRPKRDFSRPQAPVPGYERGWRRRWHDLETEREVAALLAAGDTNGAFKRMYALPPGGLLELTPAPGSLAALLTWVQA